MRLALGIALFLSIAGAHAALTGSQFAEKVRDLDLAAREAEILREITGGNVPAFWRKFVPLTADGFDLEVAPDYLAIGNDDDYFLAPVTPMTAQKIADRFGCVLPTPAMVDAIYAAAGIKLAPQPIPPTSAMTTVPVFAEHNALVRKQRGAENFGALVAGHKKDIVIPPNPKPGKVAIYGWHQTNGVPIQPLYQGHTDQWVDYSHGARLVRVLARRDEFRLDPGVRVLINSPATNNPAKPNRLILYALPNGNTIEQTIGRRQRANDNFRFNLQHIGAQTRWLRQRQTKENITMAYLEADGLSWPAWRRKNDSDNKRIPEIVDAIRKRVDEQARVVLTGHSGGGSFTFGLLDGVSKIPDWIDRITFLDSNYAYATETHADKLVTWLRADENNVLCVFAYKDFIARLDGKPFVSENGGTWGRSAAMLGDLRKHFAFETEAQPPLQIHRALDNRIQFVLHENPGAKILHTVQVEKNGFIHAILLGSDRENDSYAYFGERVYEELISLN